MNIDKLQFHTTGFLSDAEYSFHIHNILCNYKTSFGNAESLTLNLDEIPPGLPIWSKKKQFDFSEDGKSIVINISSQKSTNTKGKITGKPSARSVFETIHFVLEKAVEEYKKQFIKE